MRLPKITGKELMKVALKLGFVYVHNRGSHAIFKSDAGKRIVIPHHANEDLGPGLLNKIIKSDFGITRDEFFKLLK